MRKILMVGVLDVPSSTNVAMAKGFQALGCSVDVYNYRTVANRLGSFQAMWDDFRKFLIGRSYDLIVFCKVNGMHPAILDEAKEVGPTWYWFMDPMKTAKAIDATFYAQNATFASATASDVADRFKLVNKNACHIIEGYDPDIYYYEEIKKIRDVIFIGNVTPSRVAEIFHLRKSGMKIDVFGSGWPAVIEAEPPVFGEDERIEINQSRFVLNLPQDSFIFSDRIVKSLACGANVISRRCEDIKMFNGYIRLYGTPYEAVQFTKQDHGALYAQRLAKMMKEDFSWQSTCERLLTTLDEWKVKQPIKRHETVEDVRKRWVNGDSNQEGM